MCEYSKSVGSLDARIVKSAAVDAESSEPGLILGVTRLKQHLRDGNDALEKARDEMRRIEPLLTELVASARPRNTRSTQMPYAIPISYHIRRIYASRIRMTSCFVLELTLSHSRGILPTSQSSWEIIFKLINNICRL